MSSIAPSGNTDFCQLSAKSFTGYRRRDKEMRYDDVESMHKMVYPLPPVGAYVYVMEKVKYTHPRKALKEEHYIVSGNHKDVYNRPCVYKVEGYTQGIDNPWQGNNHICLVRVCRNRACNFHRSIDTVSVACGAYKLVVIEEKDLDEFF